MPTPLPATPYPLGRARREAKVWAVFCAFWIGVLAVIGCAMLAGCDSPGLRAPSPASNSARALAIPQSLAFGAEPLPIVPCLYQADPPEPAPAPVPEPDPEPKPTRGPYVSLNDEISGSVGAFIAVRPETNGKLVRFIAAPGLNVFPADMLRDPTQTVVSASSAGRYALTAYTALGDVPSEPETCVIVVGSPGPTPPVPPGPGPPVPPGPIGFRVLIVEETADRDDLPVAQLNAICSVRVREYLNSHCTKVSGTPEWRIFDQNVSMEHESSTWKEAMSRQRNSTPWIVITNGVDGFEGPLPPDEAALLELLKKYGGP